MSTSNAVLITGCSTGIGRATALACADAGLPTWATARRSETLGDLEAAGCRVLALDVTDEEARVQAVKAVEAEHGAVGALVNNAGHGGGGPVEETPMELWREVFETNVFSLVRLCQLVLPGMRAQQHGTVVNVGSAAGLVTPPTAAAYSGTKYALEAISDALRLEIAELGVRVVLIEPGAVRTEFMHNGDLRSSRVLSLGPYDTFKRNVDKMAEHAHRPGAPGVLEAADVAKVIVGAITSDHPRARYKVGRQAKMMPRVRGLLGDRRWDKMLMRRVPFSE